jgi:cellulose synthase (UDP-forming)
MASLNLVATGLDAATVRRNTQGSEAFDADSTLVYVDPTWKRVVYQAVSVGALIVYALYLAYRAAYTINHDVLAFSLAVYLAEVHGFFSLYFYFHQVWALRTRMPVAAPPGLSVDVFITTYNEDVELLRQTVRGAASMRYPHRTYILDDGRRKEVKALAEELGCEYITRATNEHAKAGNWNNAFARTHGELIATFDADHVPRANFLERTLGYFRDPKVALVQTPQQYHNVDSIQHRANWKTRRLYSEQDVFFNLVMPGKDHFNAAFFCGTGAVLRRSALAPRGGIETGTITEDLHTAVVLHAAGWKSVYVNDLLVTGLAPMDLRGFEAQRLRWAEGNLRTLAFVNPITAPGLTIDQRISYAASLYHWTIGFPKLIFYLSPPAMLLTGAYPIANFGSHFLLVYFAFLVSLVGSYALLSRGTGRLLMDELFNMASVFTLIRATKRAIFGRSRPSVFVVTDKRGGDAPSLARVFPHLLLLALSVVAVVWGGLEAGFGVTDDYLGTGVCSFWTLYNVVLVAGVVSLALAPQHKRQSYRFRASFPVQIEKDEEAAGRPGTGVPPVLGLTHEVSAGGCTLLSPVPLDTGSNLLLRFELGLERLETTAEVLAVRPRLNGWFAHGVCFLDQSRDTVDQLNDAIFNIAVPEMFVQLSEPSPARRTARLLLARLRRHFSSREVRHLVALPGEAASGTERVSIVTRDISLSGAAWISPLPLRPGDQVDLSVQTPTGRWSGRGRVVRAVARSSATSRFRTWVIGMRFETPVDGHLAAWIRKGRTAP